MRSRALDNNVIGVASGYFDNPSNPRLEGFASDYFKRYVDAYINSPRRVALMPGGEIGDVSALLRLWHSGAEQLIHADSAASPLGSADLIWEQFLRSIEELRVEWAAWLRYQWSPALTRDYKNILLNWRQDLQETLEFTRIHTSPLAPKRGSALVRLSDALQVTLGEMQIDSAYVEEIRRERIDAVQYAIAYCFNMFWRGIHYRKQTHGMAVSFHCVRDAAVAMTAQEDGDLEAGSTEVLWGEILDACLRENIIARDYELFADILRGFRTTVQFGREYKDRIADMNAAEDLQRRHELLDDAVLAVFLEHRIAPALRSTSARASMLSVLKGIKESGNPTIRAIGPFIYEAGKLLLDSNALRLVDVKRRRRFTNGNIWKVYRLPGRE